VIVVPCPDFYVALGLVTNYARKTDFVRCLYYAEFRQGVQSRCKKLAFLRGVNLEGMLVLNGLEMVNDKIRILNDNELNIVLLKLVEYLGHSNPIISGVAFNEVGFLLA
jgi:hypothetical protein